MEDNQNGRQQTGRRPKWKMNKMEDKQNWSKLELLF